MRVSRTRFSKRRSKRKTEFPIVAVVQKKRKPLYSRSNPFALAVKKIDDGSSLQKNIYGDRDLEMQGRSKGFVEDGKTKDQVRQESKRRNPSRPQKKSRGTIDYKNVILLRNLITAEGKILPRRINKLTAKQQRSVQKAIKSARIMGLVPFINKSRPFS